MDMTANESGDLMTGSGDEAPFQDLPHRAIDKLRSGVIEEAHKLLVRLVRKHNHHSEVVFNLALARKQLGYDISAEALFRQAFELGYQFPDSAKLEPKLGAAGVLIWTDETDSVHIELKQRPRQPNLSFVGFSPLTQHR